MLDVDAPPAFYSRQDVRPFCPGGQTYGVRPQDAETGANAHFGFSVDPTCGTLMLSGGDAMDNWLVEHPGAIALGEAPRFAIVEASKLPTPRDHATLIVGTLQRRRLLFGEGRLSDGLGTLADTWSYPLEGCL